MIILRTALSRKVIYQICLILFFIVNVYLLSLAYLFKIYPVSFLTADKLNLSTFYNKNYFLQDELDEINKQLNLKLNKFNNEQKVLLILNRLRNNVKKNGSCMGCNIIKKISHIKEGGGLACSGMANLFAAALLANDIPARLVVLNRNFFDRYDAHLSVEVFINDKWVIIDPTFGISLRDNRNRLSFHEAQQIFLQSKNGDLIFENLDHKKVEYPVTISNYYMNFKPLLNNVIYDLRKPIIFFDFKLNNMFKKVFIIKLDKLSYQHVTWLNILHIFKLILLIIMPFQIILIVLQFKSFFKKTF